MSENNPIERPQPLTVLCILSFISAGISAFTIFVPSLEPILTASTTANTQLPEEAKSMLILVFQAGYSFHLTNFLLTLGSAYGAYQMWHLNKIGFHIYALSNLASLFVPTIVLGLKVDTFGMIITFALIGLYAMFIKLMK